MLRICVIVITFRGKEFCVESLRSVYAHVDRVVYVHSEKGWNGEIGNTVHQRIIERFEDTEKKLTHIIFDSTDQNKQRQTGVDWLKENNVPFDYLMTIDTDEVCGDDFWAKIQLELEENLKRENKFKGYTCKWLAYLKSPFFQVTPPAEYYPTVFVHRDHVEELSQSIRGSSITHQGYLDAELHHYTAVRESFKEVWEKVEATCKAEKFETVSKDVWIEQIWNKLPNAQNLHYAMRFRTVWKGVKEITLEEMPLVMRNNAIVKAWQKYSKPIVQVKQDKLTPELLKKYGLPADFGPGHIEWQMASKRNKWAAMQEELRGEGKPVKLAIMTIVSGEYQWYAPLFLDRIKKELPGVVPIVIIRGNCALPKNIVFPNGPVCQITESPLFLFDKYKIDGYTTAALRFTQELPNIKVFDAVFITDIDMLLMAEEIPLAVQHIRSMRKNGLKCYDNYQSSVTEGYPRCPGVHFVTRDWWDITRAAREKYSKDLIENGAKSYFWDEAMLYKVIIGSGLPGPSRQPNLWANHGIHLGDWRRRIKNKAPHGSLNAFESAYIKKLLVDKEFMNLVEVCAPYLEGLKETFEIWRKM